MNGLPERVEKQIEKIVGSEGLELVHIDYRKQGRVYLLRIDIDKEGGVNLDDCENVAHQVGTYLEVDDPVPGEYELQVSSPGLDRKFYKESKGEIQLPTGGKVFTRSFDQPLGAEGITAHWAWADEAGQMPRLAWTILKSRVAMTGGQISLPRRVSRSSRTRSRGEYEAPRLLRQNG